MDDGDHPLIEHLHCFCSSPARRSLLGLLVFRLPWLLVLGG
jgi:hypothetical protein